MRAYTPRMGFADLPKDQQEKVISDVFCIQCQKSFRLDRFVEREFRGMTMIEGKCPQCGSMLTKPVGSGTAGMPHRE